MSNFKTLKFEMPSNCSAKIIGDFIEKAEINLSPDMLKCCIEAIITKERVEMLKALAEEFGFRLISEEEI